MYVDLMNYRAAAAAAYNASVNDAVERLWSIITVALIDDYRAMGV